MVHVKALAYIIRIIPAMIFFQKLCLPQLLQGWKSEMFLLFELGLDLNNIISSKWLLNELLWLQLKHSVLAA